MRISIERNRTDFKWMWSSTGPLGYRIPDMAWFWIGPIILVWRR